MGSKAIQTVSHPSTYAVLSVFCFSILPDPPKNSLRRTLVRTQSSLKLVPIPSHTLRLPDSMRPVHPVFHVFHVSQLDPSIPNTIPNRIQPPPPPVKVGREPELEISKILDSKIDWRRRHFQLLYLRCWARYEGTNDEETSWLLATELGHTSELVKNFHPPTKPGPYSGSNACSAEASAT